VTNGRPEGTERSFVFYLNLVYIDKIHLNVPVLVRGKNGFALG